jgi:hypothetical protein
MLFLISGRSFDTSTLRSFDSAQDAQCKPAQDFRDITTLGEGNPTIMLTNKFYSLCFLYACLFYYLLKPTGF